jgi:DNA-directed RNA polymerase subunit RPC12/RpoP
MKSGTTAPYACFECRKSFKRQQFHSSHNRFMTDEQSRAQQREVTEFEEIRKYNCPDCGQPAHYMGLDFKAPSKGNTQAWKEVRLFIEAGKLYVRREK